MRLDNSWCFLTQTPDHGKTHREEATAPGAVPRWQRSDLSRPGVHRPPGYRLPPQRLDHGRAETGGRRLL